MPAEWAPHEATLLAWPHQKNDWPGKFAAIPWVYAEIVRLLALSEPVLLIISPGSERRVRGVLNKNNVDLKQVTFLPAPTDRAWMRDSGPIGVHDSVKQRQLLDWGFNAWAKYDNWQNDDCVPAIVAGHLKRQAIQPTHNNRRVILEGGSIDVNGDGLLLTTEECLLSDVQCRNPGFSRGDYEQVFGQWLGVSETIWLHRGIVGDDTHGHVDDLARFVAPRTVVTVIENNPNDENYSLLQENRERLIGWTDSAKSKLSVVDLPTPEPMIFSRQRLPVSYANFYIGNEIVLVPTFNDPNDRAALGILAELFPSRRVVGVHSVDLVWGLGTLHCLSQQIIAPSKTQPV